MTRTWTPLSETPEDNDLRIAQLDGFEQIRLDSGAGSLYAWGKSEGGNVMGGVSIFKDPLTDAVYAITIYNGETVPYRKGDHDNALREHTAVEEDA